MRYHLSFAVQFVILIPNFIAGTAPNQERIRRDHSSMPQEDASSSDYRGIHSLFTPKDILSDNEHSISLRFRKQRKLNTLEGERKREIAELHESYKSQMESRDKKIEELYSHINDVKFR